MRLTQDVWGPRNFQAVQSKSTKDVYGFLNEGFGVETQKGALKKHHQLVRPLERFGHRNSGVRTALREQNMHRWRRKLYVHLSTSVHVPSGPGRGWTRGPRLGVRVEGSVAHQHLETVRSVA